MSVEDRLHAWAAGALAAAPDVDVPVARLDGRRRRRTGAMLLAAAAVVMLSAGLFALRPHGSTTPPSTAAATDPARPTAPAGYRAVTFHGLTLDVPASWPFDAERCGTPIADTVIIGGAEAACAVARQPDVTSVTFAFLVLDGAPGGSSTTLAGVDGTRADTSTDRLHTTEIVLPDLRVDLTITSPSTGRIADLLGTARITTVDANGCPARQDLTALAASHPGGDSTALVPGAPSSVAVCRYVDTYLERGVTLATGAAEHAQAVLNGLPSGLSRADPSTYVPSTCRTSDRPLSEPIPPGELQLGDREEFTVRVGYADGPTLVLHARIGWCGSLGITNGARTGQRLESLWQLLVDAAGDRGGWPSEVTPIR